jgi:hypothetical protein
MWFFVELDRLVKRIDPLDNGNGSQPDAAVDWLLERWRLGMEAQKDIRNASQKDDQERKSAALSPLRDLHTWDRSHSPYYCKILPTVSRFFILV